VIPPAYTYIVSKYRFLVSVQNKHIVYTLKDACDLIETPYWLTNKGLKYRGLKNENRYIMMDLFNPHLVI